MRGLLGTGTPDPAAALVIPGARRIHTFGMRYAIDVAFLDDAMRVVRLMTVAPNRLTPRVRGARFVLEGAAGALSEVGIGDRLRIVGTSD
jgi:uncharacterized membrane protein (UPF0127 family)